MSMTDSARAFAFTALPTSSRAEQKGQNHLRSALPYSHLIGARVARQRCPILQSGTRSIFAYQPLSRGHLYFADLGDISTLH
jgi:hypothetical protein